jgi:hypothetical protein
MRAFAVMSGESLGNLVASFCAATLPHGEWTHLAHLRVGAWHVHRHGADEALRLLRERIRRLNERHGTPNTATQGYHETVTVAYVRLIAEFLGTFAESVPLESRVAALVQGPLAHKEILLRFWSREVLMSPRARAEWVQPDASPLALPADARPTRGHGRGRNRGLIAPA